MGAPMGNQNAAGPHTGRSGRNTRFKIRLRRNYQRAYLKASAKYLKKRRLKR